MQTLAYRNILSPAHFSFKSVFLSFLKTNKNWQFWRSVYEKNCETQIFIFAIFEKIFLLLYVSRIQLIKVCLILQFLEVTMDEPAQKKIRLPKKAEKVKNKVILVLCF